VGGAAQRNSHKRQFSCLFDFPPERRRCFVSATLIQWAVLISGHVMHAPGFRRDRGLSGLGVTFLEAAYFLSRGLCFRAYCVPKAE
jgi:hypothetical protein